MKTKVPFKQKISKQIVSLFNFQGRINRRNFAISLIVCLLTMATAMALKIEVGDKYIILPQLLDVVKYIGLYILVSQASKRCHDINHSGTFLIIPFLIFAILFIKGNKGANAYSEPPTSPTI
ncbi:MAG: DUF805 domain-containing protein [Bacteroidales bacterium]